MHVCMSVCICIYVCTIYLFIYSYVFVGMLVSVSSERGRYGSRSLIYIDNESYGIINSLLLWFYQTWSLVRFLLTDVVIWDNKFWWGVRFKLIFTQFRFLLRLKQVAELSYGFGYGISRDCIVSFGHNFGYGNNWYKRVDLY